MNLPTIIPLEITVNDYYSQLAADIQSAIKKKNISPTTFSVGRLRTWGSCLKVATVKTSVIKPLSHYDCHFTFI